MAEPAPWCEDCQEITRSQRECIHCGGSVKKVTVQLPDAAGGPGNAGPGPHEGWRCETCLVLWDGGKRYGFACEAHGGHAARGPEPRATLRRGQAIGNYPGAN